MSKTTMKKQRITLRRNQCWLIEMQGASALTRVQIREAKPNAVRVWVWSNLYARYEPSLEQWLARDRLRFVQRLTTK